VTGRLILARALGVFLGLLALAMLWNGVDALRYARAALEIVIMGLQFLATVPLALGAYWLWTRDRRAILATGGGMGVCAVVGTLAASYWTEPSERLSAGLGALGASIVLLVILVLLARLAVNTSRSTAESLPRIGF
jgi:hypothetical protein